MTESIASRLYLFWTAMPAGVGVSMRQMLDSLSEWYPKIQAQAVSSALTNLRKGKVRDPNEPGLYLPKLAVRFDHVTKRYYDFGRLSSATLEKMVPESVLNRSFSDLLTRTTTLNSAMGEDGFLKSTELLRDDEIRTVIGQIPFNLIYRVEDTIKEIGRAKRLLELGEIPGEIPLFKEDSDTEGDHAG